VKYTQVYDGEWILPMPQGGHRVRCCDCGLVHRFDFRVVTRKGKRVVIFRATRDKRATAAARKRGAP